MRADQSREKYVMALMGVVRDAPSVAEGCRRVGIHRSTYYRWVRRVRAGSSVAGSRGGMSVERARLEAQVVSLALANPPWGPQMLFYWLVADGVGVGSASQVWRILKRHGLNRAGYRFEVMRLAMGFEAADEMVLPAKARPVRPPGRLDASIPGDLVQMDCFHVGRIKGAKIAGFGQGTVWQYTAIDVASSHVWAEIYTSRHNPDPIRTSTLAHKVAASLAHYGWDLKAVTTDNGNEFKADLFTNTIEGLGAQHRKITPGRPQTNGKVEQVHNTILREFWHPTFAQYHEPSITGLRSDLAAYLTWYNTQRPHTGRWNQGKPPTQIIQPNTGNHP